MTDRSRSSSLTRSIVDDLEVTAQTRGRPKSRALPSRTKASKVPGAISDREASRRDRALEKEFTKAQKKAHKERPPSPASSVGSAAQHITKVTAQVHQWSPSVSPVPREEAVLSASDQETPTVRPPTTVRKARPTATFTPTAAGLRQGDSTLSLSKEVQDLISKSISQSIDSALLARGFGPSRTRDVSPAPVPPRSRQARSEVHRERQRDPPHRSPSPSNRSDISILAYQDEFGYTFSDDEAGPSEPPATGTLFKYEQFATLLRKAKAAANFGASSSATAKTVSEPPDSISLLFTEPVTDQEVVPSPKLFTELVQKQWVLPGAVASPSSMDKKLYKVEKHFEDLLDLPKVEPPRGQFGITQRPTF